MLGNPSDEPFHYTSSIPLVAPGLQECVSRLCQSLMASQTTVAGSEGTITLETTIKSKQQRPYASRLVLSDATS